jgi:hypothetical protein
MKSVVYNKALPKVVHLDRNSIRNANKFNNGLSTPFTVTEFQYFYVSFFFLQFPVQTSIGFILIWIINCIVTEQLTVYFTKAFWFWKCNRKSRTFDWRHQSLDISKLITSQRWTYIILNTCSYYWNIRTSSQTFGQVFNTNFRSRHVGGISILVESLKFYPLVGNLSGISLKIQRICRIYFYLVSMETRGHMLAGTVHAQNSNK